MSSSSDLPKFCDAGMAGGLLAGHAGEFAIVRNPAYVHPPFELYPLAPTPALPLTELSAVVCDMDGTTTTTEPLCIHSMEIMVRRITSRMAMGDWAGFSRQDDYPHIIGNSTTRHIEFLLGKYGNRIKPLDYFRALIESSLWTIAVGRDALRRDEARSALERLGLAEAEKEAETAGLLQGNAALKQLKAFADQYLNDRRQGLALPDFPGLVRGAIEIYYARYHQILQEIAHGRAAQLGLELLHGDDPRLIRPMPGVELFLAVAKGLLSESETAAVYDALAPRLAWHGHAAEGAPDYTLPAARASLISATRRFGQQPLKVAIVTSSIRYEAEIVLGELFSQLRVSMADWPVDEHTRQRLALEFESPQKYYDAIITASDSSEIRLKPHRDLYSIALHRLGIAPEKFNSVLGLEDSESGLIAIRAAGIGLAVAVPFTDTLGHNLKAATKINYRGLWELMAEDRFFLAG